MNSTGCNIKNVSKQDMGALEGMITRFYPYAKGKLGFKDDIVVNLVSDPQNSKDPFGKTAYYDPNKMQITIFVDKRHVKDMLRSFSHELVHHAQNCRGEFSGNDDVEPGYAQRDPHMRRMEGEAYLLGNGFLVRDFEDQIKCRHLKENKKMSITNEQAKKMAEAMVERLMPEHFESFKAGILEEAPDGGPATYADKAIAHFRSKVEEIQGALAAMGSNSGNLTDDNLEVPKGLISALVADIEAYQSGGRLDTTGTEGSQDPVTAETIEEMSDEYSEGMAARFGHLDVDRDDALPPGPEPEAANGEPHARAPADDPEDKEEMVEEGKECSKCNENPCECDSEKGNVKEEIDYRNNLLFERLKDKWTK
jgi:hypothetical protein